MRSSFLALVQPLICFSCDCLAWAVVLFEIDEVPEAISFRESRSQSFAMLVHPAFQIIGDSDVQDARLAAHDVDVKSSVLKSSHYAGEPQLEQSRKFYRGAAVHQYCQAGFLRAAGCVEMDHAELAP